ncbi:hypothetical protein LQK91_15910 [Pantoea sp. MHSD4]|uniref:hypothetical protein n=1 Tax=Pantoea sp. MHSD4 TaxID=2898077 RepID=UPI000CF56DD8|nr:hypothetical protein [Pantoea sp. MHSD4]MCD2357898.1 hypothetical protein [Pantoea sp. MHSD4]PQL27291.1 hypothetical protein C5L22_16725 [Pantoea ananatis]
MEDGGYYAIKGFNFQLDKAISEILLAKSDTQEFFIENIQDINSSNIVYQVKHKETQNFSYSKIREPVIKLINDHIDNPNCDFSLYCYFADKEPNILKLSDSDLDELLNINLTVKSSDKLKKLAGFVANFTPKIRSDFNKNFEIAFAPNYDSQYESLIKILIKIGLAANEEEAQIYYCLMAEYLRNLVITNSDPSTRKCSREGLIQGVKFARKTIFHSLADYHQKRERILKIYKKELNLPTIDKDIHVFLGRELSKDESGLCKLITNVIEGHYNRATYDVKPITFILDFEIPLYLKRHLLQQKLYYNDGFESVEFNVDYFSKQHFFTRKTTSRGKVTESLDQISFKMKLITMDNYKSASHLFLPRISIAFDCSSANEQFKKNGGLITSYFGLSTEEITHLLRRK